jgi:hypothetical protein
MKKKFKEHFANTYKHLTKKIMASVYRSTFLVHFTMLAPVSRSQLGNQHQNQRDLNHIYRGTPTWGLFVGNLSDVHR